MSKHNNDRKKFEEKVKKDQIKSFLQPHTKEVAVDFNAIIQAACDKALQDANEAVSRGQKKDKKKS